MKTFEIDGIYYKVTSEDTVEVTSREDKYTGFISIPDTVVHDSTTYSVTGIGDKAFYECESLRKVTIPQSVKSIGEMAFAGCDKLQDIYCYHETPVPIKSNTITSFSFVHVPKDCLETYKKVNVWKNFPTMEDVNGHVESIEFYEKKYSCDNMCAIKPELSIMPSQSSELLKQEWSISDNGRGFIDSKTGLFVGINPGNVTISVKVTDKDGKTFTASTEVLVGKTCEPPEIYFCAGVICAVSKTPRSSCYFTYRFLDVEDGIGVHQTQISPKVEVTAYAKAEGYNDSETVTKILDIATSYLQQEPEIPEEDIDDEQAVL